jgi:hypothetical protein
MNFGVQKSWEKLKPHESVLISLYTYLSMCYLNFLAMSWLIFDILMMWCHFVKLAHNVWTMVCVKILSCWQHNASMFVGIISGKLSRDFTRPLGSPRGLKGLLHMLNAIVSSTTANLCFMLWFCFSFCYAKGLAKCKFDDIWLVTNIVYLDPLICMC